MRPDCDVHPPVADGVAAPVNEPVASLRIGFVDSDPIIGLDVHSACADAVRNVATELTDDVRYATFH